MAKPENIIHHGQVSSYDAKTHTARVAFDDWDGMVSGPLQILQPGSTRLRVKSPLKPGDHVAVMFQANGIEEGYILGSPYTSSNLPDNGSENDYMIKFPDKDITIKIGADSGKVEVLAPNSEVVSTCKTASTTASDSMSATAPQINVRGNVGVTNETGGDMSMAIRGTINLVGTMNVEGDVIVNGISFKNHRHTCPDGTTSPPHN